MLSLFTTPTYTSRFITIQFINSDFGFKLVEWLAGKPKGHAFLPSMFASVQFCLEQGLTLATPKMRETFEEDCRL